jgi:triphosphoribosyl-dephospho-CoA synthase
VTALIDEAELTPKPALVDSLLSRSSSVLDPGHMVRAGLAGLHAGQHGARRVLQAGGSSTRAGRDALAAHERDLLSLNASPGGAADLLAATLFLDMLAHHDVSGS